MSTTSSEDTQCKALTEDGDRCQRPARGDGFCYQHDENDDTIDDDDGGGSEQSDDGATERSNDGSGSTADREEDDEGSMDEHDREGRRAATMESPEREIQESDIEQVREKVQDVAADVVGHPLDGITSVDGTDEGWRVAVEVVERRGVPDTQDILGRYEIRMDRDATVTGYQRTHRYRRDDMSHDI